MKFALIKMARNDTEMATHDEKWQNYLVEVQREKKFRETAELQCTKTWNSFSSKWLKQKMAKLLSNGLLSKRKKECGFSDNQNAYKIFLLIPYPCCVYRKK